jgi:predicted dehydrogenase
MSRRSISRRNFVRGTAAGAALAVAAPTIIPSSALGDDKVAAPSKRITLGFIGIGKQASGHLGALTGKTETQTLAVCDIHKLRRESAKETVDKKYKDLERKGANSCDQYVDFRELLGRKDIDAVVIGTPDHWHTIPNIEACKAGKDIYCEKPLTLTIHEAKTVIEAVRKHDRVFQTGSQQRSSGPFREVCEYIQNGRLGKIKEVHIGVGPTSKFCDLKAEDADPNVDFNVWLGQAPERPYNEILCRKGLPNTYPFNPGWRDYREYSGGYITDWGAHHFDITQWALGMDGSGPNEILPPENKGDQYGAKFIYHSTPVGDNIVCTHVHEVYKGMNNKGKQVTESNGITFIGEKGKIFVNRGYAVSDPEGIMKEPISAGDKHLQKTTEHRQNWLDCIRTRQKPICDVAIGAGSVTVCHLVNLAYWHGKKLTWDPKTWEFPGDAEANGWRDRERRGKYQLPEV